MYTPKLCTIYMIGSILRWFQFQTCVNFKNDRTWIENTHRHVLSFCAPFCNVSRGFMLFFSLSSKKENRNNPKLCSVITMDHGLVPWTLGCCHSLESFVWDARLGLVPAHLAHRDLCWRSSCVKGWNTGCGGDDWRGQVTKMFLFKGFFWGWEFHQTLKLVLNFINLSMVYSTRLDDLALRSTRSMEVMNSTYSHQLDS